MLLSPQVPLHKTLIRLIVSLFSAQIFVFSLSITFSTWRRWYRWKISERRPLPLGSMFRILTSIPYVSPLGKILASQGKILTILVLFSLEIPQKSNLGFGFTLLKACFLCWSWNVLSHIFHIFFSNTLRRAYVFWTDIFFSFISWNLFCGGEVDDLHGEGPLEF